MKEHIVEISICIIMIVFAIIGGFIIKSFIPNKETEQAEECEHEWVVTSEFSLLSQTHYRTVSKCIKCGKVIK